jgi:NAD(P)-dependent dehydrogenase (short-subunit alcohol dehydrogenase family)
MKTILITGVGKGIGRSLVEKYLAEGHEVIGTYLSTAPDYSHEQLTVFPLDLADSKSIEDCVAQITALHKKIDILHNNAGAQFDTEETTVVISKLRQTLEVNLVGTIDFTERLLPLMNKGGHIINTSSSAGSLALAGKESHYPGHYPAYKISKTALNMYTRTLSLRLKDQDIIVSSIHPGWVKTEMGGEEADITPSEAAESIYTLALLRPETGKFWFNGEEYPW